MQKVLGKSAALLAKKQVDLIGIANVCVAIFCLGGKAEEVTEMWYKERMAPEGVKVFNPAFDVTDNDLIAGIVTEFGVARAPYTESLKEIFKKKEEANK